MNRLLLSTIAGLPLLLATSTSLADETQPSDPKPAAAQDAPAAKANEPVLERRSNALFGSGIAMSSLGGLGVLGGLGYFLADSAAYDSCITASNGITGTGGESLTCETDPVPGIAILITGVLLAGAGIPMAVVGGQRVPVEPQVSFSVSPTDGGARAGVTVHF